MAEFKIGADHTTEQVLMEIPIDSRKCIIKLNAQAARELAQGLNDAAEMINPSRMILEGKG